MIRSKLIVSFVFLMLGIFISQATHAAKFVSNSIDFEGERIRFIKVEGQIYEGDNEKFNRVINKYIDGRTPVELVILNSTGGDVEEASDMVDTIIENDLATMVLPKERCLSACFGVYAAGGDRILYPDSIVGVHRAIIDGEGDNLDAKITSLEMARLYKELDVPASIRKKMLNTPPNKIYYLTLKEKKVMSTEVSQFEETAPPKNADELDAWLNESSSTPVTAAGKY